MARTSFRSQVFQLLLLFAAVPAIALTIFGYYLVVQTQLNEQPSKNFNLKQLTDYYNELLFADIELAADKYVRDAILPSATLDYLLLIDGDADDQVTSVLSPDSLSDSVIRLIVSAAELRSQGLVAAGNQHYQFVRRQMPDGRTMLAGLIHDSSFSDLLEGMRQETTSRSISQELRSSYIMFIGGLFFSVTLLTILAAYFFSARVSRSLANPLTELSEASRRIAAGNYTQVVTATGEGEIGHLIDNFNQMTRRLESATTRLAQTERVTAWRQVARQFAHELKNPLQPILVSLYRIEQQLGDSHDLELIREPLRAASEEVKHLTELAERFSQLAKLPPPKLEPVALAQLLRSVIELYTQQLEPFDFETTLPATEITIPADRNYLREAMHNLLRNSIDACKPGDKIMVQLQTTGDHVEIIVGDTGSGMDEKTLLSARLPYFTTKKKGTGLGLAIVEKSISELGGQLKVVSQPGSGTTVTISLPMENRQ